MGCLPSTEQSGTSKRIDELIRENVKKTDAFRLLLLGAGESGKSTFAKQIKYIHMDGFTQDEKIFYKDSIKNNVLYAINSLIQAAEDFDVEISDATRILMDEVQAVRSESLDKAAAKKIKNLWETPEVDQAYSMYAQFHLLDSTKFLLDNAEKFVQSGYIPDREDILQCRVKSLGVQELKFSIEGNDFVIVDVGGQRSERRKWIKCFGGITGIIFFVALSAFDLVLYEDLETNRIHESLDLFQDICNTRMFSETPIILFLNKTDLFKEKIENGVKLTVAFPEYEGEHTYEECSDFIQTEFLSRNFNGDKPIFSHFTCALDEDNIRVVFEAVRGIVLQQHILNDHI